MMRIMLMTGVLFAALPAAAQSFNCQKAQTAVEKMVCADAGLRDLDEYLGRYYAAARTAVEGAASCVQQDQAQWLKAARGVCSNADCLKAAYLDRLAELDPLQPGATALKNVDLPDVPALVWVIAPASDRVAAPPNPKAQPFEAQGTIVNEITGGDGFMLVTDDGRKIPLMLLMFLEGKSQDQLTALSKNTNARYRVRGYVAADGARRFFEPSRCAFIYRVPASAKTAGRPDVDRDLQDMEKVRLTVLTQGKVCPDPNRPCPGFNNNELSFSMARPFTFDRGRDKSQPFYAVILKSGPLCGISAGERLQAQKQFPNAKVFVHRYFCDDFNDNVTYTNINEKSGFIAVYGGETEQEARQMLARANAAGYADANLRRMEVIVVYQIE